MKGGSAIYCPVCNNRQTVGEAGAKLDLPMKVACQKCGARLSLGASRSGGIHVAVEKAATS